MLTFLITVEALDMFQNKLQKENQTPQTVAWAISFNVKSGRVRQTKADY